MGHLLFIDLTHVKILAHIAGQHTEELTQIAHVLQLLHLIEIVGQGQLVLAELFLQLSGLLLIILLLGLFNKGEHIAHAENTGGHTVGVEQLDHVQLFTGTHKLDGLAGGGLNGECRTAAGITVELGEQYAINAQRLVKGRRRIDGILTGHGIDHQQNLMGLHRCLDGLQLVHQRLVHMQAACGIQKHHVVAVVTGIFQGFLGNMYRLILSHLKDRDVQLLADHLQLRDRSGTVHVAGNQQRAFAELAAHQAGQFRAVGGFTGTLQAHHHHDRGALIGYRQLGIGAAHQVRHLFVDDLDDLLGGGQAVQHVGTDTALGHLGDKFLDDLIADIGLQQRQAHLAQSFADIVLRQAALAAQALECGIQFFRKSLKCHRLTPLTMRHCLQSARQAPLYGDYHTGGS